MKDVEHQHADDPRNVFGEMYRRGPSVAADGGERDAADAAERESDADADAGDAEMKDVNHTNGDEDHNPNRVWSRGSADEVREAE